MALDNSDIVARFCPATNDGDTFIYTEMLDRSNRKGNNGHRLVKTFYHRSVDEFWEQWPTIKELCDLANVRACTRLSPRTFKSVGRVFTRLVVDAAVTDNWAGMKSLYNRACGIAPVEQKLWLYDVDAIGPETETLGAYMEKLGVLVATIPSRKGVHYIAKPMDVARCLPWKVLKCGSFDGLPVQLHKDNPTNLYIPDGAA